MINNMLAFFFMFYFIVCTYADPAEKLAKCRLQMSKADLSHEKDSKYIAESNWIDTVSNILVPICNNVHTFQENHKLHLHIFKAKHHIFDELLLTCGFLEKYLVNDTIDKKEYKPVLDNLLPTCTALYNYDQNIVANTHESQFTLDYFYSSTCKFLREYQNVDEKDYKESKFTVDDFFPLCNFVQNYNKNEDVHQLPDPFCIEFSNEY
ncbi:uncharacterized protein LOC100575094 isoform X2 [Acyrthosiphon pisum]|uniref:Uncharacterized protein n=1 Tax=Acyrthosiphon pisum TaxID=7029 RepID=A0A8R2H996_ACYPI|nr:uncharacterized protein LOC100575094 isoform X2 [Acyrthosiphon pisum]XP_016662093.1 uncharacterized protein LOC100575094 isoform X2 [Acyrthosiphon pisum]XP_016662094.1 uncharacterized protein LOC100575094 isoform X2 [Acyrthosiphon pisum]|eukprot:XP_016662092.1 PREDICTED: uncharacterized protein LOC100575094 isoform X2 [Acyrthosiphon pisum]